jgi:hypothetical protein
MPRTNKTEPNDAAADDNLKGTAGDDANTSSAEFLAGFDDADAGEEVDLDAIAERAKTKKPKAAAPAPTDAAAADAPAAAPSPTPKPVETPAADDRQDGEDEDSDPELDPFAQSKMVQKILARQTEQEHALKTSQGRVAALQRELDQLKKAGGPSRAAPAASPAPAAAAAEPAPPPKRPEREKVRGELPEVAAAMDEQDQALQDLRKELEDARAARAEAPPPAPAPARATETQEDVEARQLAELDPDWAPKMNSDAFKLWLSTQPEDYRTKVLSSSKAMEVATALKKFDGFMAQRQGDEDEDPAAHRRTSRVERAVAPRGNGSRPGGLKRTLSSAELFVQGFNE